MRCSIESQEQTGGEEMASDIQTVERYLALIRGAGEVWARKMFGEYAVYCDGKVVGLICDNALFIKYTSGAETLCGPLQLAPPYEGTKPHIRVAPGMDAAMLTALVRHTAQVLPAPKKKRKKAQREKWPLQTRE